MSSKKDYNPTLCGEGNIVDFLDRIFEFLYRRSDFFKLKNDDSTLGFADGEAENIVRSVFSKYMEQAVSEQRLTPSSETEPILADCIAEEVVVSSVESNSTVVTPPEEKSPAPSVEVNKKCKDDTDIGNRQHEDDKSDPKVSLMNLDSYNGASYEDYARAQTLQDADIRIKETTGDCLIVNEQDIQNNDATAMAPQNNLGAEPESAACALTCSEEELAWFKRIAGAAKILGYKEDSTVKASMKIKDYFPNNDDNKILNGLTKMQSTVFAKEGIFMEQLLISGKRSLDEAIEKHNKKLSK